MPGCVIFDRRPLEYAFRDSGHSSGSAGTYTFSGLSFGSTDPERGLIVGLAYNGQSGHGLATGVTIGGATATRLDSFAASAFTYNCEFWYVAAPTGTSGSVVITFSANNINRNIGVFVYSMIPAVSLVSSIGDEAGVFDPVSKTLSIDIPATGIAIGLSVCNALGPSATWTNLTEDNDDRAPAGGTQTSASFQSPSGQMGRSVTCAFASPSSFMALFIAVFGP